MVFTLETMCVVGEMIRSRHGAEFNIDPVEYGPVFPGKRQCAVTRVEVIELVARFGFANAQCEHKLGYCQSRRTIHDTPAQGLVDR